MSKIRDALKMNTAVYEMFLTVTEGNITMQNLVDSTNKAMELNTEALEELKRIESAQIATIKNFGEIDALAYSTPGTLKRLEESTYLEDSIRRKKFLLIGKAIMKMNRWQRIWWAITGHHKYMTYKFWEGKN